METLATVKKEQNITIVQKAFTDFLNGNIAGIIDACSNDVEWTTHENANVPYAHSYRGRQGVGEFFKALSAGIDYIKFQPKEFYGDGDKVFVKGYHNAKVKSTGKSFGHDFLMEFTLSEDSISSFFAWVDTRDQTTAFSN